MNDYFDVEHKEDFYARETLLNIKGTLSTILSSAVDDELIDINPCSLVKKGTLKGRETVEKDPYDTNDTQEFIFQAQKDDVKACLNSV